MEKPTLSDDGLVGRGWPGGFTMVACAALIALALAARTARAETPPELLKYSGDYKYAGTRDQGVAIVDKALDDGLSDLNMVMRLLVKKAIGDHFIEQIQIEVKGGRIGIKAGELPKTTTEDGKTENVKTPDGKYTIKVTHHFWEGKLIATSVGDNGTTTTVFELQPDGKTLQCAVTFKSDRLTKAIRYKLAYKRK
ncbi:MAG: hypothetical protein ACHQ53_02020 [Polyangiales bacterium]